MGKWFEQEVDKGRAKYLGLCNFDQAGVEKMQALLCAARIRPAVHQFELHPLQQNRAMVQFCRQEGIAVMAYSPLGAPHKVERYLRNVVSKSGPAKAAVQRGQFSVLAHP